MASANQPKPGSLWARLFGMDQDDETTTPSTAPIADVPDDIAAAVAEANQPASPLPAPPPLAVPFEGPSAEPVPAEASLMPVPLALPVANTEAPAGIPLAMPVSPPAAEEPPAPLPPCSSCGSPRKPGMIFCDDCGYLFPLASASRSGLIEAVPAEPYLAEPMSPNPFATEAPMASSLRIKDRYLLGQLLSEKLGVNRYRALDAGVEPSAPVIVVRFAREPEAPLAEAVAVEADEEIVPTFDTVFPFPEMKPVEGIPMALAADAPVWPRPSWEHDLLTRANHPSLPAVVDAFSDGGFDYLVLEDPQGRSLWDAWDDPDLDQAARYRWLQDIAQTLDALHKAGAILECLSPDHIIVSDDHRIRVADLSDLLPIPIPADAPLRQTLYTPPELIQSRRTADARASLYSFGALVYSLEYLHHGLEEKDFEKPFTPRQITDRFPDVHPLLLRLINKTFVQDIHTRFPSDEAAKTDATGIQELLQTLRVCERVFDSVRLDIAAWTTTGMVRTGNEDAFAFLHGVDSRQDDLFEYGLVLLCDGMGGYDAGEVAAAMAITEMKKFFLQQPMFAGLAGQDPPQEPVDVEAAKKLFEAGLKHANKQVFTASRTPGKGKRGMGCTAEAVYIDPHHVIVGHVGDSRVYHLREGRLVQMTRDQTLVNRLVELGQISEAEAEHHPRKNELQQAIGGQPEVSVGIYHSRIRRGDWVLVCSDGLSNHISNQELEKMLTREASNSAEEAARRLLNLVNLRGATDNATIVVVRAS